MGSCGAQVPVIGTLAILGHLTSRLAAGKQVALEALLSQPSEIWSPSDCPLCANQIPLPESHGLGDPTDSAA